MSDKRLLPERVKIISDGTASKTHVIDMETCKSIKGVVHIHWSLNVGSHALAQLTVGGVPAELVALVQEIEFLSIGSQETQTNYGKIIVTRTGKDVYRIRICR